MPDPEQKDPIVFLLTELLKETRRSNDAQQKREILSLAQAADYLGVSQLTLREWTRMQKIPFYRVGQKFIRFRKSKLDKWLERHDVSVRD